jgi:hypothetical protein
MVVDETAITPFVSNQIDQLDTQFYYETIPSLFKLLQELVFLRERIPTEIRDCVAAATSRLNDDSLAIRSTLESC